MFTGVFINSVSFSPSFLLFPSIARSLCGKLTNLNVKTAAKVWRGTVGRVHDGVFKYAIGGEI
jgi:hypothetical protein